MTQLTATSVTFGVPVTDMDEATQWYKAWLGDVPQLDPAPGVREFEVMPNVWLQISEETVGSPSAHAFRLGVDDAAAWHARLSNLNVTVEDIVEVPGAVKFFDFRDPYGNLLSLYEVLG